MIEKVVLRGLQTDISPLAVESGNDGNRRVVNPLLDAKNCRYIFSEHGEGFTIENVKGTVIAAFSNAGEKCIGAFEDTINNRVIWFVYNSDPSLCGMYEYDGEGLTSKKLLEGSFLGFSTNAVISHFGVIGDLYYWTETDHTTGVIDRQRVINRTRSYTYAGFDASHITLIKPTPINPMTIGDVPENRWPSYNRSRDSTIPFNKVTDKNFQFSYRFKFWDDEYSVIASPSLVSFGDYQGDAYNTFFNNRIRVRVTPPTNVGFIKQVELLVREGNNGVWRIWHTALTPNGQIDKYFTNHESQIDVDQIETSKVFESIPSISRALCVHKNRVFLTADKEGFDVNDQLSLTITNEFDFLLATLSSTSTHFFSTGTKSFTISSGSLGGYTSAQYGRHFKIRTTVGFTTYEMYGRFTGVSGSLLTFEIEKADALAGNYNSWTIIPVSPDPAFKYWRTNGSWDIGINLFDSKHRAMGVVAKKTFQNSIGGTRAITVTISGSMGSTPEAAYYSIGVTKEKTWEQYAQIYGRIMFYVQDVFEGFVDDDNYFQYNGRIFKTQIPTASSQYSKVYIQLPANMPFTPDSNYYIRSVTTLANQEVERIQEVVDGFIVCNGFNNTVWNASNVFIKLDVFKPREVVDDTFYEVGQRYPITGGVLSQLVISGIQGDAYIAPSHDYLFTRIASKNIFFFTAIYPYYFTTVSEKLNYSGFFTPTPITKSVPAEVVDQSEIIGFKPPAYSAPIMRVYDYSKADLDLGHPFLELTEKKAIKRPSVIRFSNKYVQDTRINGLSSFDFENQHTLPLDRGPVIKLLDMGNYILAVHSRATTTLYTEEGLIRTADDQESLISSKDVIGHDRRLHGKFGSIHPESIASDGEIAFGFDVHKGVVWRYTNEGQVDISASGRREYFRSIAKTIIASKNTTRVFGGIDPFNKEYLITIGGFTHAFNYVEGVWTCKYEFIPEHMTTLNQRLMSCKNGNLYIHNEATVYNNFYSTQYYRYLKIAVNPHVRKNKVWQGIQLAQDKHTTADLADEGNEYKRAVITTPEGQETYMKRDEFERIEGVEYAHILRDINQTVNLLAGQIALRDGDDIRSKYIILELFDSRINSKASIQFINLAYLLSEYSE